MPSLILSLGSNVNARTNIGAAIEALRKEFGELTLSTVYESEAVGFTGDNFLNLVLSTQTEKPLEEIVSSLKHIEDSMGRNRTLPKFADRTIDIDILIFGEENGASCGLNLPRAEILTNAFVLQPLAEILPGLSNSQTGKTYQQLWEQFDQASQKLWPTDLRF